LLKTTGEIMAVRNFNEAEKQKLIQIISQGSQVLGEVDDLRSGLRDTVKSIAEELELKPALINKAISVAHKGNYQNIADDLDALESILNSVGKL
jgi:transposase-like protein